MSIIIKEKLKLPRLKYIQTKLGRFMKKANETFTSKVCAKKSNMSSLKCVVFDVSYIMLDSSKIAQRDLTDIVRKLFKNLNVINNTAPSLLLARRDRRD